MKAAVYRGPSLMQVQDVALPELKPDEFLLNVGACAICGSDLHAYTQAWTPIGDIMGHEFAGTVEEIGADVTRVTIGERLAVIPFVACGTCRDCLAGRANLCDSPAGHAGGYGEQTILSERSVLFEVPEDMAIETAAFLEPTAVAVRAVNRAAHDPSAPAIVLGLGPIGQSIVQILKARNVSTVIGIDLSERRRDLATELGADHVVDPAAGDTVEQVQRIIGASSHRGYSFSEAETVFECSGAPVVVDQVITGLVRKAGTVVMVALFETQVSFDPNPLVRKEVSVVGSYAYTEPDWTQAFELLRGRLIDPTPLVSHRFPLSRVNEAFSMQQDKSQSMKVVVIPDTKHEGR